MTTDNPQGETISAFPPKAQCICGERDAEPCRVEDHEIVWDGDTFKGTRCERHGGHKFKFVMPPNPFNEKPPGFA